VGHFLRTGVLFPVCISETLIDPVAVGGWNDQALLATDGREIRLPGVVTLPATSAALSEAIRSGVEVADDGRVYGLVRVHHWCGCDPVRERMARIDITLMLRFLGEGEHEAPGGVCARGGGESFSEWGWSASEYEVFRQWLDRHGED
jgi:hypothetical protein